MIGLKPHSVLHMMVFGNDPERQYRAYQFYAVVDGYMQHITNRIASEIGLESEMDLRYNALGRTGPGDEEEIGQAVADQLSEKLFGKRGIRVIWFGGRREAWVPPRSK